VKPSKDSVPASRDVMQFLCFLRSQGKSIKWLRAHLAAISFFCNLEGWLNPCRTLLIRRHWRVGKGITPDTRTDGSKSQGVKHYTEGSACPHSLPRTDNEKILV
ncbi:hypothetical protein JRQ81_013306, partial [Phrynocephalus forsythii]